MQLAAYPATASAIGAEGLANSHWLGIVATDPVLNKVDDGPTVVLVLSIEINVMPALASTDHASCDQ